MAWVIPDDYDQSAEKSIAHVVPNVEFPIDELQIFGGAHVALVNPTCAKCNIDIRIKEIVGERNGRLHVGFNQTMYSINGRLPIDLAVYRGGESTMHGELKVTGVTVYVEGQGYLL